MKESGSLEVSWRHYLAFMAAAAHQCEPLMEIEEERCKTFGGDKAWFKDTTSVPQMLRSLGAINVKLAHRPWELQPQDIERLIGSWRLADLTEAVIILVQFHAMCSFSAGLGVLSECDLALDGRKKERKMSFSSVAEGLRSNNPGIIRTLLNFQEALESASCDDMLDSVEAEDREDMCEMLAGGTLRFVTYDPSHRPFYASDFNWRNHGYEIVERLMPKTAQLLNNTLLFTYNMTDNSLCSVQHVDSTPLRRAIWNYTQKVYGLDYDDYNYREVNVLLSRHTKAYLKKAACVPHQLESDDFALVDLGVTAEEMVHTMLLVMEARKESELLYWLHTLNSLQ
jgi:sestrin